MLKAGVLHAGDMADLLNEIIVAGGTTALTVPVNRTAILSWMGRCPDRSSWSVAEASAGEVVGFQWIEPAGYLPGDAAEIATFTKA